MRKTTLIACLSDMHSGGSTALFPDREWDFKNGINHKPTPEQRQMYAHFMKCATYARTNRKDKRLFVVHDGDCTEGVHHGSTQIITYNKKEQAEIHSELMDGFLQRAAFSKKAGDKIWYVVGTEVHTEDIEHDIGKDLRAEKTEDGVYAFEHLEVEINGRLVWCIHHGKGAGVGSKEGNALRNWLADIWWDCKKTGRRAPDLVISGHTHTPAYNVYAISDGEQYSLMHGVVCPSWQSKTRFAYKVSPVAINQIGAVFIEISAEGDIKLPVFMKMRTKSSDVVVV